MSEYIYCGFWRRLIAYPVDWVILMLFATTLSLIAILLFDTSVFSDNSSIDNLFNDPHIFSHPITTLLI
jgi:hypothetical protein